MFTSPYRPVISESSAEPRVLSASEQAELDRLYWDESDGAVRVDDIAERFDLPPNQVHRFASPWPSELTCLLCAAPAIATSRTGRSNGHLQCGGCGASVRSRTSRYSSYWDDGAPPMIAADVMAAEVDPVPVPHVMIRRRLGDRVRDLSGDASRAVSALECAGRPFVDGRTVLVLEPHDGIEEIQNLLAGHPASTLAVDSLRTLGDSQVEAMQNLLHLTLDGWRVVSANDTQAWSRDGQERFDDEDGWPAQEHRSVHDWAAVDSNDGRIIDATHRFTTGW